MDQIIFFLNWPKFNKLTRFNYQWKKERIRKIHLFKIVILVYFNQKTDTIF